MTRRPIAVRHGDREPAHVGAALPIVGSLKPDRRRHRASGSGHISRGHGRVPPVQAIHRVGRGTTRRDHQQQNDNLLHTDTNEMCRRRVPPPFPTRTARTWFNQKA